MQAEALSLSDNTTAENPTQQARQNIDTLTQGAVTLTTAAQRCVKDFYDCGQDIENVVVLSIN